MDQGNPRLEAMARLDGMLARLDGIVRPDVGTGRSEKAAEPPVQIPAFLRDGSARPRSEVGERRHRRLTVVVTAMPFVAIGLAVLGFLTL